MKIMVYKEKNKNKNLMARAQLKWMLQLLGWLNKKKRIQSSFVKTTLQVFSKPSFLLKIVQLVPH